MEKSKKIHIIILLTAILLGYLYIEKDSEYEHIYNILTFLYANYVGVLIIEKNKKTILQFLIFFSSIVIVAYIYNYIYIKNHIGEHKSIEGTIKKTYNSFINKIDTYKSKKMTKFFNQSHDVILNKTKNTINISFDLYLDLISEIRGGQINILSFDDNEDNKLITYNNSNNVFELSENNVQGNARHIRNVPIKYNNWIRFDINIFILSDGKFEYYVKIGDTELNLKINAVIFDSSVQESVTITFGERDMPNIGFIKNLQVI